MAEPKYVGVNIEPLTDGYLLKKQGNGIIGVAPESVGSDTAANIGAAGEGVFKEKTGDELRFKKLKGGTNITVSHTETDEILISGAAVGEVNTGANIGTTGEDVFKEKVGAELRFKKIKGAGGIEVSTTGANEILISGAGIGSGESDSITATNIGAAGEGVFKEKNGDELRFKKLKGGTGITISPTGSDELEITATGGGSSTSADTSTSSVAYGTGSKLFVVSAGKAFTVGQRLRATLATDATKWLDGYVASYAGTSLTITVDKVASGASGSASNWLINVGGQPGVDGTNGTNGTNGANGTNGTDGLPAASQIEAETGTDNTKAMTPLRTAQAMAANGLLKATATTKGDIYVATAAGAVTRLAAGSNGQVLTVDSTQSSGLKYATPSSGGGGGGGSYTVATLPSASSGVGTTIWVTDGNYGYPCAAISDGTNWLKFVSDGTLATQLVPSTIAGLVGWFDANAITGLSNADPVVTWNDSSSLGNNATQATSGLRPTYRTNVYNSRPVVRFASSGGQLISPLLTSSLEFTIILVSTLSSSVSGGTPVYIGNGSGTNGYGINANSTTQMQGFFGGGGGYATVAPSPSVGLKVFTFRRASGTATFYLNGTSTGTTTASPVTPTTQSALGAFNTTYQYAGDIAECLVYNNAISLPNLSTLTRQMMAKWGIS